MRTNCVCEYTEEEERAYLYGPLPCKLLSHMMSQEISAPTWILLKTTRKLRGAPLTCVNIKELLESAGEWLLKPDEEQKA